MPSGSFVNRLAHFLSEGGYDWTGLDVGCGGGIGLLAKYGLDFAPCPNFTISDYPRERFTQGSVYDMPFEDDSFDYVVSAHLIEHLEQPIKAIEEMVRVAKHVVIANVPRYTRVKEIVKSTPCVSLDHYYFAAYPDKLEEFGLTRNDFPVWSPGATTFDGIEANHCAWYPYVDDVAELFRQTDFFSNIQFEECPGNCGETNTFGWL